MEETQATCLSRLQNYFRSGATRPYEYRKAQLQKLKSAIIGHEKQLHDALYVDLKKSPEECWVTETGFVISEINATLKNLHEWMDVESTGTNLLNFPSSSYIIREPLGVVLVISPWNYPFQLLFAPLVGAIAAGNCVVLKPSEYAPATARVVQAIVEKTFPSDYIFCIQGDGAQIIPSIMQSFRFDHVFYTGSTTVGKIIYKMAAEQLTPVTLELGGKSPCVVEADANIKVAARRIAVTKFSNAGQMCVAPDYVLVHERVKQQLIEELKKSIKSFYSEAPSTSYSYGKIIHERQFDRVIRYINDGNVIFGGKTDRNSLFIEPTLVAMNIDEITMEQERDKNGIMTEEIFGPVLPIISFRNFEEATSVISLNQNPLAFYVFTSSRKNEQKWVHSVPFGGGCVNNASWHFTNHHLPFGGRGNSGMGNYHGRHSFETFSHKKAIMKTPTWFDPSIKYPPFKGKLKLFKRIIR
jgi:aldehyde dehydrogenase (NAD+)